MLINRLQAELSDWLGELISFIPGLAVSVLRRAWLGYRLAALGREVCSKRV